MRALLIAAVVFVAACGSSAISSRDANPSDPRRDPVDSIVLQPQLISGSPGVRAGISSFLYSAIPRHDLSPVDRLFRWSTSDPTVTSIETGPSNVEGANGPWTAIVTIVGIGKSTVTMTVEGKLATVTVLGIAKP